MVNRKDITPDKCVTEIIQFIVRIITDNYPRSLKRYEINFNFNIRNYYINEINDFKFKSIFEV